MMVLHTLPVRWSVQFPTCSAADPLTMTMSQSVTRATFDDAVLTGDLPTIQAYLAQPHVQEEVQATNDYIKETRPTDASSFTLADGTIPWFRRSKRNCNDTDDVRLLSAAFRGHTHVLAWFFSHEAAAIVGRETLMLLLPLVAQFDRPRPCYQKQYTRNPLVLETLLTSYVFCDVITDYHEKQRILDATTGICQTPTVIDIAIAHGACVNSALPMLARSCQTNCVYMLNEAGAFLVGAEIVSLPSRYWEYPHVDTFMYYGVDLRGPEQLMIEAAGRSVAEEAVDFIHAGSMDADARDNNGMTALMRVAAVNPTTDLHPQFRDPTPDIADTLLAYSDVNLMDNLGRTALHFAVVHNHKVASMLVASGADPTIRDHRGLSPLDLPLVEWPSPFKLAKELLKAGADAFTVPPVKMYQPDEDDSGEFAAPYNWSSLADNSDVLPPRSFYDRIKDTESGKSFIKAHPQYFKRPTILHKNP
jgi:hypothetical protein